VTATGESADPDGSKSTPTRRRSTLLNLLLAGLAVAVVIGLLVDHFSSKSNGLIEQTYGNTTAASTQIQGCSQANGVVTISAETTSSAVGVVEVTLYALSGPGKYDNRRIVSLGNVGAGGEQWSLGVGDSDQAWECGVSTYVAAPIGPSFPQS
jgi:hypothetical protein